jgi:hypothetical protein
MASGRRDHEHLFAGEHVTQLARLLNEPGCRLRIDDFALAIGDLLLQRGVLLGQGRDARVQGMAFRGLSVDAERDDAAEQSEHRHPESPDKDTVVGGDALTANDEDPWYNVS